MPSKTIAFAVGCLLIGGCSSEDPASNPTGGGGSGNGGAAIGGSGIGGATGGVSNGGAGGATGGMSTGGGATGGLGGAGGGGPSCDLDGLATPTQFAYTNGPSGVLLYNGSDGTDTGDILVVELWFQYGAPTTPSSFTFIGQNYIDCSTCVTFQTDCDSGGCNRRFLVQSGTLDVTSVDDVGGTFTATLSNAVAIEVTFDNAISTPVPGGEVWCLDQKQISASIESLPFNPTKP